MPLLSIFRNSSYTFCRSLLLYHSCLFARPVHNIQANDLSVTKQICESSGMATDKVSDKSKKKARWMSPEGLLRSELICAQGMVILLKPSLMIIDKVPPNEATFTNAARLALALEDPEMAFDLPELSALLKLSADVKREDKVYEILHRLRATVRQVTYSTVGIIEDWFKSEDASKVGKENWDTSKEWLQQHGPFDAVVDGANLGLANQKTFSFYQLNTVVGKLHQMSPLKRLPLIILHRSRVTGGPAQNPRNKNLLEFWKKSGALYATPAGSNDDWYWLYAAVSCNCLLVTNDEMRDHLFQLLGTSFFPRWKEKHQVRVSVSTSGLAVNMPPPYSIVIQESENGSWHVPTIKGDDLETPRQWLCATRARK
ncbi:hypothetical protein GH714_035951 [Hevea brasiliensis]|uniref:ribonuclease P n=1 Tax=Hevea brasiliensis TaxID=3981 RepID=A0A6A6KTK9_HEVBR|nr:hypothetical protein GH714_035951 [Hevea brasiliensis]